MASIFREDKYILVGQLGVGEVDPDPRYQLDCLGNVRFAGNTIVYSDSIAFGRDANIVTIQADEGDLRFTANNVPLLTLTQGGVEFNKLVFNNLGNAYHFSNLSSTYFVSDSVTSNIVTSNIVTSNSITANVGALTYLSANTANISVLTSNSATVTNLTSTAIQAEYVASNTATLQYVQGVKLLEANAATVQTLAATNRVDAPNAAFQTASIGDLLGNTMTATNATLVHLTSNTLASNSITANVGTLTQMSANSATVTNLTSTAIQAEYVASNTATLQYVQGVKLLEANAATVQTLATTTLTATGNVTTSTIAAAGGSTASASYQFASNADTGMYLPMSSTLGFVTTGSERVRITSAGFVGLNTSAPTEQLHVVGNALITGSLHANTGTFSDIVIGSLSATTGEFALEDLVLSGDTNRIIYTDADGALRTSTVSMSDTGNVSVAGSITANSGDLYTLTSTNATLANLTTTSATASTIVTGALVGNTVTANTVNASNVFVTGTLEARAISGNLNASQLTSGLVSIARLPLSGAVSDILTSNLTPNRTLVSNANGKVAQSNVTTTELAFVGGVTSSIQAQIEAKANVASPTFSGTTTASNVIVTGALVGNVATFNDIESRTVTASNVTVVGNVDATTVAASGNIYANGFYVGDGSLLANVKSTTESPVYNSIRTDVATGMVVDGDLFQFNGSIYGSGAGLTGFSEKTNASLEARLSSYANSARRLYVSTTGSDDNHGKSLDKALRTIKKAASIAITQTVIFVQAGTYVEDNPIYVPPNVSVVGDSLRNTVLLAANPRLDYFHVTNMNYITQLRFVDLRSPGFCAAFPCSLAAVNIRAGRVEPQEDGETVRVPVLYSPEAPTGYYIENLPPGADAFPDKVQEVIEALTAGMADIIVQGTSVGEFGQDAKNNAGGYRRASVYLEAHIPFLQAETMAWVAVNVPQLTTQQKALCKRDVAYIVKALATDLTSGGYVASLESALKYFKGAASVLSSGTKEKTAESIVRLGLLAGYIATGTPVPLNIRLALDSIQTFFAFAGTETAVSVDGGIDVAVVRMRALFDFVALVIRSPSISAALEQIDIGGIKEELGNSARSTRQSEGTARAATLLKKSKDALRASILAWLEQQQKDPQGIQLTDANKVKCARDVGYIVEGIVFDLLNGSFEKTLEYASVYFNATGASVLPTDQVNKTADAIVYLKERAAVLIYNTVLPSNVFDKNIETLYESLLKYPNFGGSRDASGVTISVQLPGPTMYVGYRLRRSNLKKWRLEARETITAEWTVIGNEDIPEPEAVDDDADELNEAVAYVQALCEGIASIILTPEGKFPPAASRNAGGYTRAAARLFANKAFIQAEILGWVATQDVFASLTSETKALCERDVGFIVEALVGDLRIGGFGKSLEAAMAYYNGAVSKLTTPNSREPTADSIRRIGILAGVITNTPLSNEVRLQAQILQVYDEGAESAITYGTQALVGYSFYRIVMLQTHDSSSFKLGSVEFLEMQLPTILVDGPNDTIGLNTVIRGFEIVDAGEGYIDGTVPVVITPTVPPEGGSYPDQEDAEADAIVTGGKVTSIVMRKRFYGSVQSLAIGFGGTGYAVAPTVTISGNAKGKAWIDSFGSVVRLELVDGGSGYAGVAPTVTFSAPPVGGQIATATASVQGSTEPGYEWSLLRGRDYQGGATVSIPGGSRPAVVVAIMTDDFAEMRAPLYEAGTRGASRNVDERGRLKSLELMHPGSGYSQTLGLSPTISIPPPESIQPVIVGSPYLQNCSNLSGPWDTTGEKVPVTWRLPWNPSNIYNSSLDSETYDPAKTSDERKGVRKLDNSGAGGGSRIDGRCCAPLSPLRSFVVDAFTQLCQGGIGFLLVNLAYAQFVSTFGTFCNIHSLATGGSVANFSNSVTDFGRRGLIAQGYYRDPYLSGSIAPLPTTGLTSEELAAKYYVEPGDGSAPYYASSVSELAFKPNKTGKGYAERPNDTMWPRMTIASPGAQPGHAQAQGRVKIKTLEPGETSTGLFQLQLLNSEGVFTPGAGYKAPPTVIIDAPTENYIAGENDKLEQAEAFARLSGVSSIRVNITRGLPLRFANNRRPDTGSIVRIHGVFYTVFSATPVDGSPPGTYDITFEGSEGAPPYADIGHEIDFFFVSSLSTGGHVFEFCGDDVNGCTYNSLPEYGGNYVESNQLITVPPAKMFYTSSDHKGKQKIGPFFTVDQANGSVTLDAKSFDLSKISGLGPFIRKNVVQGVRVEEISSSVDLVSSAGAPDDAAVPTQAAVKKYVDKRAVPSINTGNAGNVLRIDPSGTGYVWAQNTVESFGVVQVNLRADVITGLIADGDATVYGNLTCNTVIANDVETGTLKTNSIARSLPTISGASGIVTHDYNVGSVWYHTLPTSNFTVALINVPIDAVYMVYKITLVIDQGATPRMPASLSIDGSLQTIKWKSNMVPIGTANGIDTLSFKLLWLVGTWLVVGY